MKARMQASTLKNPRGSVRNVTSLIGLSDEVRRTLRVSELSTFDDNYWRFSTEHFGLPASEVDVDFRLFTFKDGSDITDEKNHTYLRALKDLILTYLIDPPSSHPKWTVVRRGLFRGARKLLRFMQSEGIRRFCDLSKYDVDCFLEEVQSEPNRSGKKLSDRTLRGRLSGLADFSEQNLKMENGVGFDIFWEYGSLTEWTREASEVNIPRNGPATLEIPDEISREIFQCALADLSLASSIVSIAKARKEHGKEWRQVRGRKVKSNPFPWESFGYSSVHDFKSASHRVSAACYIVTAFLTGMRVHEMLNIRVGKNNNWREIDVDFEGARRKFYFVQTETRKLQHEPVTYLWQTLPIVKEALHAAELVLAHTRKEFDDQFLFPSCPGKEHSISSKAINERLKKFVRYHCIFHAGKPWNLLTHQFRKTFARMMIRKGLDIIALKDQLKHFDVEMTRVYGDLNLYVELQQEIFSVSKEKYNELLSGNYPIIGGGAEEVIDLRRQFLGMTKESRLNFLEELPRRALIEQLDDGLCLYRHEKALCGGGKDNCRPADCNNSVLNASGKERTLNWRYQENLKLISFYEGQPTKLAFLHSRNDELEKLIAQLRCFGETNGKG